MSTPVPAGLKLGIVEPVRAVEAFTRRGLLKKTFAWQDVWQEEHARVFAVAGVAKMDVLRLFYDGVNAAIADGVSFAAFEQQMTGQLVKKGFWGDVLVTDPETGEQRTTRFDQARLQLIYDVNTRQSFAAGRWAAIERNKDRLPLIMYRTMRDERVRASHRQWDGLTLPVDHPFWDAHYPPNGWNCRCTAFAVDDKAVARFKAAGQPVKTTAPPVQYVSVLNKRTGQLIHVPHGVDPGFGYNPGKVIAGGGGTAHAESGGALYATALEQVPREAAVEVIQSTLRTSEFGAFYDAPAGGQMPVAMLRPDQASSIGASARTVLLSDSTISKQRAAHPDISAADYRWVQAAIDAGEEIQDAPSSMVFVLSQEGWVVVVKATQTGRAVFLKSFRRMSSDEANADQELTRLRKRKAVR